MIAIIDYDAGNILSVQKACAALGQTYLLTGDQEKILGADHVILPGVGAFGDAMKSLERSGLTEVLREIVRRKIPLLGICLGLQLFFDRSEESPGVPGLSLLPGEIRRIPQVETDGSSLKIPHMGWNNLTFPKESRLFAGIPEGVYVYFVHSYYLYTEKTEIAAARTHYGADIVASVEWENIFACQFHPEKSGKWGLKILENFLSLS